MQDSTSLRFPAPSFTILPPVVPYQGTRGIDAWGAGGFAAPRLHDGAHVAHKGLDFKGNPGDRVQMPFAALIAHRGIAYADSILGSIHLTGIDGAIGYTAKLLYVFLSEFPVGASAHAGADIGALQDVATHWENTDPARGPMQNHCHLEMYFNGTLIDPTTLVKVG